jgi:hypothetical protein
MGKEIDPRQSERDLKGAAVGAIVALIGIEPLLFLPTDWPDVKSAVILTIASIILGCAAGGIGANAHNRLLAVIYGILLFIVLPSLYLPCLLLPVITFSPFVTPSAEKVVSNMFALYFAIATVGGFCGLVGKFVGRSVPRLDEKAQPLQFTIGEALCGFVFVAFYLGMYVFLRH